MAGARLGLRAGTARARGRAMVRFDALKNRLRRTLGQSVEPERLLAGSLSGVLFLSSFARGPVAQTPIRYDLLPTNEGCAKTGPVVFPFNPYCDAHAASDRALAKIFGGDGAVAAANGWEPDGMSGSKGIHRYRGAFGDGPPGHLEDRMHLYGSQDGTGVTEIYLPPGFRYLGPIDRENGGRVFFYEKLGNRKKVTLEVFHVKDFAVRPDQRNEAGSIRIGTIGGPGGAPPDGVVSMRNGVVAPYLHAHLALRDRSRRLIPFPKAFPIGDP
jgi:hypothetical protein